MSYTSAERLKFLLFEVHDLPQLFAFEHFSHLEKGDLELILDTARNWADLEMAPFFREMDEKPVVFQDGKIHSHPQIRKILRGAGENGWIGCSKKFEHGGSQLPETMFAMIQHIFQAANNGAQGYIGLTAGAAGLITSFGSVELIETFVPKMFAGQWQGTMALTEPQAGSSLGDITAAASPTDENYFNIKGQKIFISGGEHQGADNFIHLTLAKIEGAPAGTRGISLFVVPKFRLKSDGSLESNDVETVGDFQKLGQRGYATAHLAYGEADDCRGWLVGEAHRGLHYMFQMMNEARLGVGMTAASVAQAAYYYSLNYAKERSQGRLASNKDPLAPPVEIIRHPDIRRMLLTQKSIVEGTLSLGVECGILADLAHVTQGETKKWAILLLDLLTPIIKTYGSEAGLRSCNLAVQILGGYGYTMDFAAQQFARDIRIMSIYEGTTGIQSLDLVGRKMLAENGAAMKFLLAEMHRTAANSLTINELAPLAEALKKEADRVEVVAFALSKKANEGKADAFLADATVFMEQISNVVIAWQWLKMAEISVALLASKTGRFSDDFYRGNVVTARFFFRYELPHAAAFAKTILDGEPPTVDFEEAILT